MCSHTEMCERRRGYPTDHRHRDRLFTFVRERLRGSLQDVRVYRGAYAEFLCFKKNKNSLGCQLLKGPKKFRRVLLVLHQRVPSTTGLPVCKEDDSLNSAAARERDMDQYLRENPRKGKVAIEGVCFCRNTAKSAGKKGYTGIERHTRLRGKSLDQTSSL